MRFDIRYRTLFSYTELVSESQNELRACPTNDDCQRLLDYRVAVHPSARVVSYMDSWGTRVDSFGLRRPHLAMEVVAEAAVETRPRPLPSTTPPVDALEQDEFVDAHFEFLRPDRLTTPGPQVVEAAARQLAAAGPDLVEVIFYVHRFVGASIRSLPGGAPVGLDAEQVLAAGEGVCHDLAHVAVAMCRSIGIPARYVSGYLFTDEDSSGLESVEGTVRVQTHAWIEAAIPGWGWLALDPSNGQAVGERHVKIGHGVSSDDVQPLRGVFLGPATSDVAPDVEIRKVSGSDLWRSASLVSNDGGFTGAPSSRRGPGLVAPRTFPGPGSQQ